jgi:7,8-dihydroneopterin aldolase/epimerase/oxygenase
LEHRDSISLNSMRFHTRVGLLPHEEHVPQPLELDLTVWLSLQSVGETDSPAQLLDYRDLYELVATAVGTSHHKLLEGLCELIAGRALDQFANVSRARVAARKPHAPIPGPLDSVEVVVDRLRTG